VDVWDRAFLIVRALGKHAGVCKFYPFQGDRATSIYAYPNGFSLATGPVGRDAFANRAAVDAPVHAVAVVFDLVQPAVADRRLVHQARELRLDPFGRARCHSEGEVELDLVSKSPVSRSLRPNLTRCLPLSDVVSEKASRSIHKRPKHLSGQLFQF
jgi:hypothetical protein